MKIKSIVLAIFVATFFLSPIQAIENNDFESTEIELTFNEIEEEKNLLLLSDADWKDYVTTSIEIVTGNLIVYNFCTLILNQSWKKATPEIMWSNLTSPWLWDTSSFLRNQIAHPYFGNLYYTSARSNGLNFWQAFLMTAAGSFLWENCIEAGNNSLNDFLTTTFSGCILGEILFRLGNEASNIHPLLGAIFNPAGSVNSIVTRKKLGSKKSAIHSLAFDLGFGLNTEEVYSKDNLGYFYKTRTLPQVFLGAEVVYNNPFGHETKEFMDQFSAKIKGKISSKNFFVRGDFDTLFFSKALNLGNLFDSNFGVNFDYDLIYTDSSFLSLNSFGLFFNQKINHKLFTFSYNLFTDFILFGVTENSFKTKQDFAEAGPATYTFGPKAKINLNFAQQLFGELNLKLETDFLFSYGNTVKGKNLEGNFFVIDLEGVYKHVIYKGLYGGINLDWMKKIRLDTDSLVCNRNYFSTSIFAEYKF